MKKTAILLLLVLVSATSSSWGKTKLDRGIVKNTFVPKGTFFFGGTASYTEHSNDDYKFIVMEKWKGSGYTGSVKPFVGWCFANDLGVGLSFNYDRTMLNIENMELNLSEDLGFALQNAYSISHTFSGTAFLRTYINIGDSKRFGLYNDLKFLYGRGFGKIMNGVGSSLVGTYQDITQAGIIISPGLTVFINNFMAVEASVGILGFQYKNIKQTTNQVYEGSRITKSANFKIDLFSIGLGIAFYL